MIMLEEDEKNNSKNPNRLQHICNRLQNTYPEVCEKLLQHFKMSKDQIVGKLQGTEMIIHSEVLKALANHYLRELCKMHNIKTDIFQSLLNIIENSEHVVDEILNDPSSTSLLLQGFFDYMTNDFYQNFSEEYPDDFTQGNNIYLLYSVVIILIVKQIVQKIPTTQHKVNVEFDVVMEDTSSSSSSSSRCVVGEVVKKDKIKKNVHIISSSNKRSSSSSSSNIYGNYIDDCCLYGFVF